VFCGRVYYIIKTEVSAVLGNGLKTGYYSIILCTSKDISMISAKLFRDLQRISVLGDPQFLLMMKMRLDIQVAVRKLPYGLIKVQIRDKPN